MRYDHLSKEALLNKINEFEKELKGYVNRVDQRYKVFFERNLAGIYRTKIDGEILDCNDAMAQILGYSSKEELIGNNVNILYKDINDREKHIELLRNQKFVKNRKLALLKKDGSEIWVSISTSEITNSSNNTEYMEGTMIDITELIRTQEMLIKSEENYKKMLNESPYGIIIHHKGKIRYHNKRADEILGFELKEIESLDKIFPKELEGFRHRIKEGIDHFDRVEIKAPNKAVYLDVYLKQVLFENQLMTEFSFVDIQDRIELEEEKIKTYVFKNLNENLKREIEEKEKVENELMSSLNMNVKQAAKLEAIFENSSHAIWTIDREYRMTSFNQNVSRMIEKIFGEAPKKLDRPLHDYKGLSEEFKSKWLESFDRAFNGEAVNFISDIKTPNGKSFFMNIYLNPIQDKKGVHEISGIGHDITDKVIAESKLTESLKEKEILIKEIHHRVKNNLQVISSIFNLQSSFTEEEKIREVLRESQNRIKSMAYIHESLYKSSQLGKIDFEQYLKELCKNLIHSYSRKDNHVSLLSETESVLLDLDLAIPCGLIVNEVVSNSLKHAFADRKDGIIAVFLKNSNKKVRLRLTDDGVGISDSVFTKESNSLGTQLIQTLVEQIRGDILVDGSNGTTIDITFPLN